jgi:hypothetical protein
MDTTNVYLLPYHSFPPDHRLDAASGRFACVENAIRSKEWPYDNGDDPSFFTARHDGGPLTWGICRHDVRDTIQKGSICVFLAFTKHQSSTEYRMSAVATVDEKLDRRSVFGDPRFRGKTYINLLVRPEGNVWTHDESDRHKDHRHADWLWRISEHGPMRKKQFECKYAHIYNSERFSDSDVIMAHDYVVFSQDPCETYISPKPPLVAVAKKGEHEKWVCNKLAQLTIRQAAELHPNQRDFLRSTGRGYVHRQLTFRLDKASEWRHSLISALRHARDGA